MKHIKRVMVAPLLVFIGLALIATFPGVLIITLVGGRSMRERRPTLIEWLQFYGLFLSGGFWTPALRRDIVHRWT